MTVGGTLTVGTGARKELVKAANIGSSGADGTGVDLATPLKFDHRSGVDVSSVGTGISILARYALSSQERGRSAGFG